MIRLRCRACDELSRHPGQTWCAGCAQCVYCDGEATDRPNLCDDPGCRAEAAAEKEADRWT